MGRELGPFMIHLSVPLPCSQSDKKVAVQPHTETRGRRRATAERAGPDADPFENDDDEDDEGNDHAEEEDDDDDVREVGHHVGQWVWLAAWEDGALLQAIVRSLSGATTRAIARTRPHLVRISTPGDDDSGGELPLHLVCGGQNQQYVDVVRTVRRFVQLRPESVRVADRRGRLALHCALERDDGAAAALQIFR
jgi:hypothetical protein